MSTFLGSDDCAASTVGQWMTESGRYHYSLIPVMVVIAAFSCGAKEKNKQEVQNAG